MKNPLNLLAFDLGASNGRGIIGRFDGKRIVLEELHRFENGYLEVNNMLYWDILSIYNNMKTCFTKFAASGTGDLHCFGIDTWGVDYGLLDKNGQLVSNPRSYRLGNDDDIAAVDSVVPLKEIFDRTGCCPLPLNTLMQLYRRVRENDPALEIADTMLLTPDLLSYFFTGEKHSEYTMCTTTMMLDAVKRDWAYDLIEKFSIPTSMLTPVVMPGTLSGTLLDSVAADTGAGNVPYALVGTHDTASAVAAIPGKGSFAFCSSGTWSLFGMEVDEPIMTDTVYNSKLSNEGTIQGGFRPLKNIMGLWIIQECRKQWKREGHDLSWNDIVAQASAAAPLRSIIDPDHPDFYGVGNLPKNIADYCRRTGQPVPETIGEISRCVYESLALKYRWTMERLEEMKGSAIDQLNITGGGIQNKMLCQMTADSINKPVVTGPVEGACIGNLLTQAMALGEIANIEELREVVKNSEDVSVYEPNHSDAWDEAYALLCKLAAEPA